MTMEVLKRISSKEVCGKVNIKLIPDGATSVDLFLIVGIARATKTGESTFGEWTALIGEFQAKSLIDGKQYASAKAFLPDVATEMIAGRLGDDTQGIELALIVGIKEAETPTGYEYTVRPAVELAGTSDRMAKLLAVAEKAVESEAPVVKKLAVDKKAK